VLYLPTIVEAAESSPTAAKECAYIIRKYLGKDNFTRPHVQYNGIMLVRILSDNPGPSFTKNIDAKFIAAVKELLRMGRDPSVKQMLIETLDNFEREKKADVNLAPLVEMWRKEQVKMAKVYGPKVSVSFQLTWNSHIAQRPPLTRPQGQPGPRPRTLAAPPFQNQNQNQNYFSRNHQSSRRLPGPEELASRLEEARTSAKLLTQVVQSTPPDEFLMNDLIREFADRCQSASRSIQGYMVTENPPPDNDTMLTLIETNDQLAMAMSKHQRAVLMARRAMGTNSNIPSPGANAPGGNTVSAPPGPPPSQQRDKKVANVAPAPPPRSKEAAIAVAPESSRLEPLEDPFRDPTVSTNNGAYPRDNTPPVPDQFHDRLGVEPYHPGFSTTQSYTGRQDSAVGKVTMHAARPESPVSEEDHPQGSGSKKEYEDDEKKEAPIYRY
jgi:hypothetical protein